MCGTFDKVHAHARAGRAREPTLTARAINVLRGHADEPMRPTDLQRMNRLRRSPQLDIGRAYNSRIRVRRSSRKE
jgi:hypothetical protein